MKKTIQISLMLVVTGILCFSSCVPKRKLNLSQEQVSKLKKDSTATHSSLNACLVSVKDLESQKSSLLSQKSDLQNANSSAQKDISNLSNDLKKVSTESKMTIEDQAKRLSALQGMIQAQRDVMNKLRSTIADALINFKADELSVEVKDGKVYVSLQEKLLFKSGSDQIDPKGKEALKKLGQVLNTAKDITVVIEGHTDNVPIKTKLFEDNWALSTARANSIVRILTADAGFDASRIMAAGRSNFHPLKPNDTVEGRSSNRRTEVILSPDLKELYMLLNQ